MARLDPLRRAIARSPTENQTARPESPEPDVQVDVIQTENEDAVPVKKRKTKRSFRNEWLQQFKWLRYGTGIVDGVEKITCSFCQRSGKSNDFTCVTVMADAFYIWPVNSNLAGHNGRSELSQAETL